MHRTTHHPRLPMGACLLLALLVWPLAAAQEPHTPRPDELASGYLPKEDLGIPALLAEHPEADGRGIVVAVLDTGVDLLHGGLQRTTTGLPKIVDVFDATDAGLVATDRVARVNDGTVRGLTGRLLTLGANGGEGERVFLGRVRGSQLFPGRLTDRLLRDRREEREGARRLREDRGFGEDESDEARREREAADLSADGPVYDVVVWQHEDRFACAIDTDEDGDLSEETLLIDYRDSFAVARFPDELQFGVACNLAEDGKSVSFFFDGGGHGTHVAGIIGAYYGEGNALNGLAPGARILAIKVGNNRLGGSTTHMSIIKALDYAARHGARIANASFGGGSFFQDGNEETVRFADRLIDETGLLCTFSAGNAGPALSTVGSPALSERIFAIGATVSPTTQASNYGVLDPIRTQLFGFSSRGPLYSGSVGVDFLAPGVALSTVPTWFLSSGDSWNGTSMAAPQAAGALAVILSAADAEGLDTSYRKVRLALERSSQRLPHLEHVEQGYGLLQAPAALAELERLSDRSEPLLWNVEAENDTGTGAGLYDRSVTETEPFRRKFSIEPLFPEGTSNEVKTAFSRILRVEGVPTWARVVPLVHVTSRGAEVEVEIDPGLLPEGLACAELRAIDTATDEEAMRLSMVLIRPTEVSAPSWSSEVLWSFVPGDRKSLFFHVPEGATRVRVEAIETTASENTYNVTLSQASAWSGVLESGRRLPLEKGTPQELALAVEAGTTLEVVAYSRWHTNIAGSLSLRVSFDGLVAADPSLQIPSGSGGVSWKLHAPLGEVDGRIKVQMDGVFTPLEMRWELTRDPWYDRVGEEGTMFLARGLGTLRADKAGEELIVAFNAGDEFDDFLDDAFWRIRDPYGVEVGHGFLHEGRADVKAPARGDFTLEATIVAYGREFLRVGADRILAPERVRPFKGDGATVHRGIYEGVPGRDAISRVELGTGEHENLYLRVPAWPAGSIYRGRLRVTDDRSSVPLQVTSFTCDTRLAASPTRQREAALARLRSDLDQGMWLGDLAAAEAARDALAAFGASLSSLEADELVVRVGSPDGRAASSASLTEQAVSEAGKSTPDRARLGKIHALLALAHLLDGDRPGAAEAAKAALDAKPPEYLKLIARHARALGEDDPGKAVDSAKKLVEANPYDRRAARWFVEAAHAAGKAAVARHAAETWLDRFPDDVDTARELLELTRAPEGESF